MAGENNKPNTAPAPEDKNKAPETKPEDNKNKQTIGDVLEKEKGGKNNDTVPLATHIELKNQNKELKREIAEIREMIADGASKREISREVKDIAEKYGADENLISDLVAAAEARAKSKFDGEISEKLKGITEREEKGRIDKLLTDQFDAAVKDMPEYKEIADPEIIKNLAMLPQNRDKTFADLIEKTYGKFVKGKKTIEKTTPHGGADDETVDFQKARTDVEYFRHVMATPTLKKQYNDKMLGINSRRHKK